MAETSIEELSVDELEATVLDPVTVEIDPVTLSIDDIREKIAQLSITSEGEDLKFAMRDLKKALLANPVATALLGPEDIGEMVKYLYKLTERDVQVTTEKKERKEAKASLAKVKKFHELDANMLKDIEDDLF